MAYPASTKTLQKWVQEVDEKASLLKSAAQQQHGLSAGGQLNMDMIRRFFDLLVSVNNFFIAAGAVTGIAAYVTAEKQDQVADPAAEFVAMRAAIVATLDWLRTNVPADDFGNPAVSYKLGFNFPAGNTTPSAALTFTAAQTAGYRTQLTTLIATIG